MFMGKDMYIMKELRRLRKIKNLIASEIKELEQNKEVDDMTIYDLEEWMQETELEISKILSQIKN